MELKILDNCCSLNYLNLIRKVALDSDNWNLRWPNNSIDKFLKLEIISNQQAINPILSGLAMGLLCQIYDAGGQGLFIPNIHWCYIGMKDEVTKDNLHVDHIELPPNFVKIVGLINDDWKEEYGGNFFYKETSNYMKPTSFYVFDPREWHKSTKILTDKKRFAIDFTVDKIQDLLREIGWE